MIEGIVREQIGLMLTDQGADESQVKSKTSAIILLIFFLFVAQTFFSQLTIFSCLIASSALLSFCLLDRLRLEWALSQLIVEFSVQEEVKRGDEAELNLVIKNPSPVSMGWVRVTIRFAEGMGSPLSRYLPSHHQLVCRGALRCSQLSSGHIWGVELCAEGLFGLAHVSRRELRHCKVRVLTRKVNTLAFGDQKSEKLHVHHHDPQAFRDQRKTKGGDDDFAELREYIPSDSIHHVAWRPSAKRGSLLTRVFEQQHERRYLIAIDLNPLMRIMCFNERRIDLAIDWLCQELKRLTGEYVGILSFDHRIVSELPIDREYLTSQRLRGILPILAQPVFEDEVAETHDELWERLSEYLQWTGLLYPHQRTRLDFESSLSPSLRLQTSLSIQEMAQWLEENVSQEDLPFLGSFDSEVNEHRLRRFCSEIGVRMTPKLPRTSLELHHGLSEVFRIARRSKATDLIVISHSQRIEPSKDLPLFSEWMNERRELSWIQAGSVTAKRPSALVKLGVRLSYRAALFSALNGNKPSTSISTAQRAHFHWKS